MERLHKMTRPPKIRTFTVFSTGPRLLGLARDPKVLSGPGEPPPGFVGPTTSRSEWILYWALAKVFNDPINPRLPPFHGGEEWSYQTSVEGGRRERGGAVVDFVIYLPGQKIGLRLQTERFHVFAGPGKQSYDAVQERNLSRSMTIKDLYEQDLGLDDRTGRTAVARVVELLGGRRRIDPVTTQRARRVRA